MKASIWLSMAGVVCTLCQPAKESKPFESFKSRHLSSAIYGRRKKLKATSEYQLQVVMANLNSDASMNVRSIYKETALRRRSHEDDYNEVS